MKHFVTLATIYCRASAPASEHILVIAATAAFTGMLDVCCNVITASLYICKAAPGDGTDVAIIRYRTHTDFTGMLYGALFNTRDEPPPFFFPEILKAKMHVGCYICKVNDRTPGRDRMT